MIVFPCHVCQTSLSAETSQIGQLVRCPTCLTTLRVPNAAPTEQQPVAVGAPSELTTTTQEKKFTPPSPQQQMRVTVPQHLVPNRGGGKRYGFNCGYCSSRLEATESMAGQHGQCPTCGNDIVIPILDRYGRLIDPMTGKIIKQDPHPVHAYAAAGERAPQIIRQPDRSQTIICPRCSGQSPITANNCRACGMPFTMEGTTLEAAGTSNGFCVASLVLGIIGIPAACVVIPSILAIVFGIIGFNQIAKSGAEGGGKGMAIAGMICGGIGALIAATIYFH